MPEPVQVKQPKIEAVPLFVKPIQYETRKKVDNKIIRVQPSIIRNNAVFVNMSLFGS